MLFHRLLPLPWLTDPRSTIYSDPTEAFGPITLFSSNHLVQKKMTRVTNFGRKRTYVEAGFKGNGDMEAVGVDDPSVPVEDANAATAKEVATNGPPKKKRKRTKKLKAKRGEGEKVSEVPADTIDDGAARDAPTLKENTVAVRGKSKKSKGQLDRNKDKKSKGAQPAICSPIVLDLKSRPAASWRAEQSELRRQKRISERQADTICFACRKKGHAAKDCPNSRLDDSLEDEAGSKVVPGVGICYRYGVTLLCLAFCKFNDI
jgi:zinc finger CCHC domain-containing protein 9